MHAQLPPQVHNLANCATEWIVGKRENVTRNMQHETRIGIGYDIHRLVENRKLILGGVEITFRLGLLGHSDADVLLHAICDAILGAAAMGDIGQHFPDTVLKYHGISSLSLLEQVMELVTDKYSVGNIDSVVIAEQPKLAPFIPEMRRKIANVLKLEQDQISIKATTQEGLGDIGKCKAIAAKAVVILFRVRS